MSLTSFQQQAVAARGNVLVSASAGTGKTSTLAERCLHCLREERPRASLDEILVVTFTEAAAAEMRKRIRERLEQTAAQNPGDLHWPEQIALFDAAHIGTLHSFCLKLARQHFHALGLDPQFRVMDEGEARLLAGESLDAILLEHYAGKGEMAEAVQRLIQSYGGGRDEAVRSLVLRLHHHTQTRPDPAGWFQRQLAMFAEPEPRLWRQWLMEGISEWRTRWLPELKAMADKNGKAAECHGILGGMQKDFIRGQMAELLSKLNEAGKVWPSKRKGELEKPLKPFFADVEFLLSVTTVSDGKDPLAEDWQWTREPMTALLRLAEEFAARFNQDKREAGVVDFHDLEQFALQLLWEFAENRPTKIAQHWRDKIRFVFVDEYQDINAAQDKIIDALSRDGAEANRFLVGDVKQSIYRFRQADPKIFRGYSRRWRGANGKTVALVENFRSREAVLAFANSVFDLLMREDIGGVTYDDEAQLKFGAPEKRSALTLISDPTPRAELLLRIKGDSGETSDETPAAEDAADISGSMADLQEAEKEARMIALRLRQLHEGQHLIWDRKLEQQRAVAWRDMAVLLRAPSSKAEGYAREFDRAGVPLIVERGGFFECAEVMDLLSLLNVLDNPLQDLPLLAVLRSPLVGLSLDELATVRLVAKGRFWTALVRWHETESPKAEGQSPNPAGIQGAQHAPDLRAKVDLFLDRFAGWRKLAQQASLSRCFEAVLSETHYADWLQGQPRGEQRCANVQRLLTLAQQFDEFQRQGLFRFLRFIEAQQEVEAEPEVASIAGEDAVRLMSIHQSKGLEFPVVVLADLSKAFNQQDLGSPMIFEATFGLCPQIKPPRAGSRYPSLPYWLARQREKRELWGEEMRLLYVAMTRACDTLILSASVSKKKFESHWRRGQPGDVAERTLLAANSYADWLGLWFAQNRDPNEDGTRKGELPLLRWRLRDDSSLVEQPESETALAHSADSLPVLDADGIERLRKILTWEYPFIPATQQAAKTSVTALRRLAAESPDDEAETLFQVSSFKFQARRPTLPPAKAGKLSAAEIGLAHHKFLQHVSLARAGNADGLKAESKRLERDRILSAEEIAVLDFKALAAFWKSDVGEQIRGQASKVMRELAFTARFTPKELADVTRKKTVPGLENEFVVVQGVADLVVLLPGEIWLADFKTDNFSADALARKKEDYEPQLKLYALALARIYQRPVTECWLHFLSCRETVRITL